MGSDNNNRQVISLASIALRCTKRIRDFLRMCYINLHFIYLLTYIAHKTKTFNYFTFDYTVSHKNDATYYF